MKFHGLGLFLLFVVGLTAQAAPLTYEQKLSDLLQIASLVRGQYGPYDYKKKHYSIDPDTLIGRYADLARPLSNVKFYYLLNQFIAEFKDSHFSGRVQTDQISTLGFVTDRIQGKAIIDEIDRNLIPVSVFNFERGDELVSLGGTPSEVLVTELMRFRGMGNPESARKLATWFLASRAGATFPPQYGKTSVGIRRQGKSEVEFVEMEWKQLGSPPEETKPEFLDAVRKPTDYLNLSIEDIYADAPQGNRLFRCQGITRTAIPEGATKILDAPFVAYYHPTPKGNIGYLRIPHYSWKNAVTGADENEIRFKQYEWAVDELERNTVGLIIDQDHNCGGSVTLVENMVGLFADKPYRGLVFQFLATRTEYLEFKSWFTELDKTTVEGKEYRAVLDLIKETWLKGESRLTRQITFNNDRLLDPNRVRYSKPIIVLNDEMSGSGGDAFPAMMQGIGRATVLGSRSMGAGGHVVEFAPLNFSGNALRMTKSLFYHPNGTPIENNGVTPDIEYHPTYADFMNGYRDYQKFYLEALFTRLP